MDNAPDAPANSTLDEQRPRGTVEQQLASFGPHSGEPPEPEEPEEETNATAEAEWPVRLTEPAAAAPSSNNETLLESRAQASPSSPNTTKPSREIGPDSAAAPISPPASDRNAPTSVRSQHPRIPTAASQQASTPKLDPGRPARRSAPASNRADQRRHYGCRRAHGRLPTSRDAIPTSNRGSPGGPRVVSRAIPSEPLRGQEHRRNASRAAGPNPRRAARLHILSRNNRRARVAHLHAFGDDRRRGPARRAPGQADDLHRRTDAAAA